VPKGLLLNTSGNPQRLPRFAFGTRTELGVYTPTSWVLRVPKVLKVIRDP